MTPGARLERRAKAIRARVQVERWRFRQRRLASGAWDRFRLALALSQRAYALSEEETRALLAEGWRVDPAGSALEPARLMIWIDAERAARLLASHPVELRLNAALLSITRLALVPFCS